VTNPSTYMFMTETAKRSVGEISYQIKNNRAAECQYVRVVLQ